MLATTAVAASLGFLAVTRRRLVRLHTRLDIVTRRIEGASHIGGVQSVYGARVPSPSRSPPSLATPATVHVAMCQLAVGVDKAANIAGARDAIFAAAASGAALVVLPEMWNCPYANDSFPSYAEEIGTVGGWGESDRVEEVSRDGEEKPPSSSASTTVKAKSSDSKKGGEDSAGGDGNVSVSGKGTATATAAVVASDWSGASSSALASQSSPSVAMLSEAARACGVVLVGGSIPERCPDSGNLYNTCCVFGRDGTMLARHRKTHLFDIDIPGEITFKESDTLSPGNALTVVDTAVGRIGIGICFDVRFPELAMACVNRGAKILVYPGAFNTVTGPLHWELLLRARAVDNQCFVLACSPARVPGATYQAWGHSTAVGPFAEVIATCGESPATVACQLDMKQVAVRRRNMPLEQQRRGDLYALHDIQP
mmetsp:Transcript_43333/g.69744  ORF Transcript_43333/g.69744 Transcript_43333/m.69744 type:complete len:426 (+) Transcript_43333:94-1371(+)